MNALELVTRSCQNLLTQNNAFWLLASLVDAGIEEGPSKSPYLRKSMDFFSRAGAPSRLCDQLRGGINGLLVEELRQVDGSLSILRNPDRGRDIEVSLPDGSIQAAIEVKRVYDQTTAHYYRDEIPVAI